MYRFDFNNFSQLDNKAVLVLVWSHVFSQPNSLPCPVLVFIDFIETMNHFAPCYICWLFSQKVEQGASAGMIH